MTDQYTSLFQTHLVQVQASSSEGTIGGAHVLRVLPTFRVISVLLELEARTMFEVKGDGQQW